MNDKWRIQRRPIADINVVPYVDVMLVLLVIFMVTAPLLTQGVEVDLPLAKAEALPEDKKLPLIVTVDASGRYFIDQEREPIEAKQLSIRVQASIKRDPTRNVLVRGDKKVDYGSVIAAMALLKQSGVAKVGLMTQFMGESSSAHEKP